MDDDIQRAIWRRTQEAGETFWDAANSGYIQRIIWRSHSKAAQDQYDKFLQGIAGEDGPR